MHRDGFHQGGVEGGSGKFSIRGVLRAEMHRDGVHQGGVEGAYLHLLMGWFASQVGEDSSSVSIFAEPLGISNKVRLRILLSRSEQGLAIPEPVPVSQTESGPPGG